MARLLGQLGMREEAEHTQAVVHADHHHAFLRQVLAILPRFGSSARREAAAIDPHHHRQARLRGCGRRPHVEIEAVFAGTLVAEDHVVINISLHAARAELDRFADPFPGAAGCGAFQRSAPTGGAAKGMPLNAVTPLFTVPLTRPVSTLTVSGTPAAAVAAIRQNKTIFRCMPNNVTWGRRPRLLRVSRPARLTAAPRSSKPANSPPYP